MTDTTTRPEQRVDRPRPDQQNQPEPKKPALGLSGTQVVGGALAATSSALVASFFGIAGTLIGAALGSVIATIGTALYTRTLREATGRLRTGVRGVTGRTGTGGATAVAPVDQAEGAMTFRTRGRRRLRLGLGTLAAFLLAIGGITAAEAMLGHPISTSKTSGTSVGSVVAPGSATPRPQPADEPTGPEDPDATPAPAATPGDGSTTAPTEEPGPGDPQPTGPAPEPTPGSDGTGAPGDGQPDQGPHDGRAPDAPAPDGDAGRPGPAPDGQAPAEPDAPAATP